MFNIIQCNLITIQLSMLV